MSECVCVCMCALNMFVSSQAVEGEAMAAADAIDASLSPLGPADADPRILAQVTCAIVCSSRHTCMLSSHQRTCMQVNCTMNPMCSDATPLDANKFDLVDAIVMNQIPKTFAVNFDPDTGYVLACSLWCIACNVCVRYALSIGVRLVEGGYAAMQLLRVDIPAGGNKVSTHDVRG
jgi:hypothetical protein